MMLPRVMTHWVKEIRKPSNPVMAHGNRIRRTLLPLLSQAVSYRLDDETVRTCQSVGPRMTENGLEVYKRWKSPAPLLWVEFNADIVRSELEKAGFPVDQTRLPKHIADQLDRREYGFPVDSRYDDGISIWQIRDRGDYIFGPSVEMFIPYEEDGFLVDRAELFYTGYCGDKVSEEELRSEGDMISANIDIPIIFCALLRAKAPVFETEKARPSVSRSRIREGAVKIGQAGKVDLPETHVIKLSEMGRLHNAALDTEMGGPADRSVKAPASSRRSPRRHIVRGHTVVRGETVFWRNPHIRGVASATPTIVRNDVPGQVPRLDLPEPDPDMSP